MRCLTAAAMLLCAAAIVLVFPITIKGLIDNSIVSATADSQLLNDYVVMVLLVAVLLAIFSAARYYTVTWLGERVITDIRQQVFNHVIQQSPEFFESTKVGDILSRLSADTTLIQSVLTSTISFGLRNTLLIIGSMLMLIITNPVVIIPILIGVVVLVTPIAFIGRSVRRLARTNQDDLAHANSIANEGISATQLVQSYTAENFETLRYAKATNTAFATAIRRVTTRSWLIVYVFIAVALTLLAGVYFGMQMVLHGEMSIGVMGQTIMYILMLGSALTTMGEVYGELMRAVGASERLYELLQLQSKINDPQQPIALQISVDGADITFANVTFSYPSRLHTNAVNAVTFHVSAGQTVAFVGPSGSGKSTIFSLLQRFYDPGEGSISIAGNTIQHYTLEQLRKSIAVVAQETIIFSDSAMENIRYGNLHADDKQVIQAAKLANADGFIQRLPDGYRTFLGERGTRLSGGQKQRIAIARAILKDAPILLLDEATSALDSESEQQVQQALAALMMNRTTLVIAHRLATIRSADTILVLDEGKIVEQGSHEVLLQDDKLYASLAKLQWKNI